MGNCLKREGNMEWDGEDYWESLNPKHSPLGNRIIDDGENCTGGSGGWNVEMQRLLDENEGFSSSSAEAITVSLFGSRGQVKFKITKKKLEELVRRDMEGGLSLEELLSGLFNTGDTHCWVDKHRTWRPVLQSIPEMS